jgi:hypothetical protein
MGPASEIKFFFLCRNPMGQYITQYRCGKHIHILVQLHLSLVTKEQFPKSLSLENNKYPCMSR